MSLNTLTFTSFRGEVLTRYNRDPDMVREISSRAQDLREIISLSQFTDPLYLGSLTLNDQEFTNACITIPFTQPYQVITFMNGLIFQNNPEVSIVSSEYFEGSINPAETPISDTWLALNWDLFLTLLDKTQISFKNSTEWVAQNYRYQKGLEPVEQEINSTAYGFLIANFLHEFREQDRTRILNWLYISAALYVGTDRTTNTSNTANEFMEALKYFMFPMENESDDNFQMRMNLLQYLRQKVSNSTSTSVSEWLENLRLLRQTAHSQYLAAGLTDNANQTTSVYYRLKAEEPGASDSDTFGITLEVAHLPNEILSVRLQPPQRPADISAADFNTNSIVDVKTTEEVILKKELQLDGQKLELTSIQCYSTRIAHADNAQGGYDFIMVTGFLTTPSGKRIPVEIQITEQGEFSYKINNLYEKQIKARLPGRIFKPITEVRISKAQARFLSRLPWKRDPSTQAAPTILLSELLLFTGGRSEDRLSYLEQQRLMYILLEKYSINMKAKSANLSEINTFVTSYSDTFKELGFHVRWNFFISFAEVQRILLRGLNSQAEFEELIGNLFPEFDNLQDIFTFARSLL